MVGRSGVESLVSWFVKVAHPQEAHAVFYSASSFFFILSAYFVIIPLRDEGAISLGLANLPQLFVGSLFLTLLAAPLSTLVFSLPNLSRPKALVLILRFFSVSLAVFFILWVSSSPGYSLSNFKGFVMKSSTIKEELKIEVGKSTPAYSSGWGDHGWFYISVALLNLITISSTWARVIDVVDSESASRLFGFIGAGATLGQLFGSLFATGMAWMGPYLLLFASLLMELAAQSSKRINMDKAYLHEELFQMRKPDSVEQTASADEQTASAARGCSVNFLASLKNPEKWAIFDGLRLILSSTYLLQVSLFLWFSAAVSSFFYFQKVNVIATTIVSPTGRRMLFAQINSFIAVFILAGQLSLTGRILTFAGVTLAICSSPIVGFLNLIAIAVWPSWVSIAVSETLRKVVNYVVTRPAREILFTVVSQDEKYKAKVCIDVVVQRLGDATAAGIYKLLYSSLNGKTTTISLYFIPVCLLWIATAFQLGRRQTQLAKI
ncbi:uncharacterized protein LOC141713269 isoform X2 [Apium graveolens]|uniref:uncharacterized protein LOC141713269 isoform X2 n=1 Tax=Apium graveolens TaxID=4045 RepID=UPI003D7AED46